MMSTMCAIDTPTVCRWAGQTNLSCFVTVAELLEIQRSPESAAEADCSREATDGHQYAGVVAHRLEPQAERGYC